MDWPSAILILNTWSAATSRQKYKKRKKKKQKKRKEGELIFNTWYY